LQVSQTPWSVLQDETFGIILLIQNK
jgi:hypothetical protein